MVLNHLSFYADYYPFGMKMPGKFGGGNYRYAYQGQEKDTETGFEAFELRQWDGRIGRWMSTDPYGQYASPYLGMGNNPISMVDPNGGYSWLGGWIRNGFSSDGLYKSGGEWGFNESSLSGSSNWGNSHADLMNVNTTFNYSDGFSRGFDNAWHSDISRILIRDYYRLEFSSNMVFFAGMEASPFSWTLLTRGASGEAGLYYTPSFGVALADGIDISLSASLTGGTYLGNSRNINAQTLLGGTSIGISLGVKALAGASLHGNYVLSGAIESGISIGLGLEVSPAGIVNVKGGAQYTPDVYPIFNF